MYINENAIAIVGIDLNLPGCQQLDEYWNILLNGIECIENVPGAVSIAGGMDKQHNYVDRMSVCKDYDKFDAAFFGYSQHEAKVMDPQHRLFLQSCWKAIENAGYKISELEGNVSVYGSVGYNTYLIQSILQEKDYLEKNGYYDVLVGNDKDYMATRVSHKLGLTGPSMTVQTACSSSLVGVHLACQSLLIGESDMCLVGGACVRVPCEQGYVYQTGFILSEDGHCRPFDEQGTGTVFGSGVGVVVLKRLEDAIEAKNHIYSVIRVSAINNDGDRKIGFTAPSFQGQTDVTQMALSLENIRPESIRFVEAHGTGTVLGDPIELNSIMNTFGLKTEEENLKYPCAIGSVKSNIGHLDTAAGVAGLIKASLCLYYKKIVPTLHFNMLNHKASFENTRFYIANRLEDIDNANYPLRAAVSAFGVGGTNVSIILEEPPKFQRKLEEQNMYLAVLSAKTGNSLQAMLDNTKQMENKFQIGALAYTLNTGREEFDYRSYLIFRKQKNTSEFLLVRESDVFNMQDNIDVRFEFSIGENGYQYGEELYHENGIYKSFIDAWLTYLNREGRIPSDDYKRIFASVNINETTKNVKEIVLQIAMAETINYYCEKILFRESMLTSYLNGEISKDKILEIYFEKRNREDGNTGLDIILIKNISMLSLYETLGNAWTRGVSINWDKLFLEEEKRHVPAPTYEFEKTRYWYEEKQSFIWRKKKKTLIHPLQSFGGVYLFFGSNGEEFKTILDEAGKKKIYAVYDEEALDLNKEVYNAHFEKLFISHNIEKTEPIRLVFLLNTDDMISVKNVFYNCVKVIQWFNQKLVIYKEISVVFVQIRGKNTESYIRSRLLDGIVSTLPKELPNVQIKQILCNHFSSDVINEISYVDQEMQVLIKDGKRYGISFEMDVEKDKQSLLKDGGTYLITGGTGNVGLFFAQEIAKRVKANIILTSQNYNEKEIYAGTSEKHIIMQTIINELRTNKSNVEIVQVDITNTKDWKHQLQSLKKRYGGINGIVHAAGKVGKALDFIDDISIENIEHYMDAKVNGAFEINKVLMDSSLDFCTYISSTVSLLGGIGDAVYSGANAILNEMANENNQSTCSVFATILDYMPRIYRDEYVLKDDVKVKNLLAGQLSEEEFSVACDKIFSNITGENLIISKINFEQRYQKEKNIRGYSKVTSEEKMAFQNISEENCKHRIQEIWKRVLESECEDYKNFFDAGGDSFLAVKIISDLNKEFSVNLPIQYVYEFPTIKLMADDLYKKMKNTGQSNSVTVQESARTNKETVYVVGMAGRFPDADNVDELWDNLLHKRQSITNFEKDESINALNAEADGKYNQYVGARAIINDVDKFDYNFFGISKLEAELMDPQQRIFIETVWNALEDAGCINMLDEAKIGVFASQGISTYLVNVLLENDKIKQDYNNVAVINNSPDALATRVSYTLDLTSVSKTVQTFCSSSLVALEEGISHIESGKCDFAVVGGVNVVVPQCSGYIYNESSIYSNTGQVKPFDDLANGTVFGNGVGVVVLASESWVKKRRLHTYAQIAGVGINNDGSQKASFLSPSVKGQSECVLEAYQRAGIELDNVCYIETHGTATHVGDPIEVHALKRVFTNEKRKKAYCALGSIKGNVGHLDRAAGITSFIKACLVAEKHCIPPVAGFEKINREIDLTDSPFYINGEPVELEKEKELYIGVSALGVGGTNVHVIIKSTKNQENTDKERTKFVIPISAKCKESLIEEKRRIARFLKQEEVALDKLAYVMQLHRRSFLVRDAIVAKNNFELIDLLEKGMYKENFKKINTILFTYSISDKSMSFVVQKLLKEEKWLEVLVKKEFSLQDCTLESEQLEKQGRRIFEYCFRNCILELLSEKVIILFAEENVPNITLDERSIHIRILEQIDEKEDCLIMTPTDISSFSELIAELWRSGIDIDWEKYNHRSQQETIHLPGYAFRKTKCWID